MSLEVGQVVSLGNPPYLTFGLSWDVTPDAQVDLDGSCVAFDLQGNVLDSVYYSKLDAFEGAITHSGDNRTGEGEGFDESVIINFEALARFERVAALCLVVNSYSGESFHKVKTSQVAVLGPGQSEPLYRLYVGATGAHTGLMLAKLYKAVDASGQLVWNFHCCADSGEGRTFADLVPTMQRSLQQVFPSVKVTPEMRIPVVRKGEMVAINPQSRVVTIGLGWDTIPGPDLDLDASCLAFDAHGDHVPQDSVSFSQKKNSNGAIVHSGDNLTGEGDGDDELIDVFLPSVPEHVFSLVFMVNIFTRDGNFRRVKTSYCRLMEENWSEVLRFPLVEHSATNGLAMCLIHRTMAGWRLVALGEGVTGAMARDSVPQVIPLVKNVMSKLNTAAIAQTIRVQPVPMLGNRGRPPPPSSQFASGGASSSGAHTSGGGGGGGGGGSCVLL